nr:hypothetical protein [Micromonospora sp. DSM 115978]
MTVDQFEELLVRSDATARYRFGTLLRHAAAGKVQVVATIRSEFQESLLASPDFANLAFSIFSLRPLSHGALRMVVEEPAHRAGLRVDRDLVTRMVDDTGGG